jgi:hypothetical protein
MTRIEIPAELAEKAASFPESSYGATTVTVVLTDGRRIADVVLAWAKQIVRVGDVVIDKPEQLGFDLGMVQDVESAP